MPFLGMHAYQHLDVMLCICEQVTSYMSRRKSRQKSEADKESRLHLLDPFSLEGDATIAVDKKLRGVKKRTYYKRSSLQQISLNRGLGLCNDIAYRLRSLPLFLPMIPRGS